MSNTIRTQKIKPVLGSNIDVEGNIAVTGKITANQLELNSNAGMISNLNAERVGGKTYQEILDAARITLPLPAGLRVNRKASSPNSKIDITFETLYVQGIWARADTYTVDITAVGELGRDTSTAEASSTWYYGWVLVKEDGATTAVLSASSTAPTLPSGYTRKRLVTMVRNDGSSNFVDFVQRGKQWSYVAQTVFFTSSDGGENDIDASQWIPEQITDILVGCQGWTYGAGGGIHMRLTIRGMVNGTPVFFAYAEGAADAIVGDYASVSSAVAMTTDNRHVYYLSQVTAGSKSAFYADIAIYGFIIPFGEI